MAQMLLANLTENMANPGPLDDERLERDNAAQPITHRGPTPPALNPDGSLDEE